MRQRFHQTFEGPILKKLKNSQHQEMDSGLGEALQLVEFTNESILVNDSTLSNCLLNNDVKDLPVCLISIIGEERKGKSFLLNYLLRRLKNPDCSNQDWMGAEDEDLQGFECRPGINSTTQGVFIWNKPFLMDTEHGKMAIFLVETEGYNRLEREKNTSIQLSTFGMLLSSYLIFNIASKINPTDLEFLEMFLDVAQKVGKVVNLDPIQHLDILVRDCDGSSMHGKAAGRTYLEATLQQLAKSKTKYQPFLMQELSKARCFLLPHPGEATARSSTGHRKEMTERFRHYLVEYFHCVLDSLPMCGRRDKSDLVLTCRQLFHQIKLFDKTIEQYSPKIQTQLQMFNTLWNVKQREQKIQQFQNYIQDQKRSWFRRLWCLLPFTDSMKTRLEKEARRIHAEFEQCLCGDSREKESVVEDLHDEMQRLI